MNGAIAAGHELTARAGAEALERGGSAVDAAVAAGAMSWAAEPALTGPCGGGFLLVRAPDGREMLVDAFTATPGKDLPPTRVLAELDEVLVPFDKRTSQRFLIGAAACAVPGVLATAALGLSRARAGHEPAAVLGRHADRLHAGGAGRRDAGRAAGERRGAAGTGRGDARRGSAARPAVRAPAPHRRPRPPRA